MNIANQLTILRVVLIFPFLYFLLNANEGGFLYRLLAFIMFGAASLTDFLDGYLARKHNLITDFGKLMDPLADKILVMAALAIFVELGYIPSWMLIVILGREFFVTGIRSIAASKGEVIPAAKLGKWKTTTQMIAILIIMLVGKTKYNFYIMLIPILLTIWSGWEYAYGGRKYFKNLK
jgi:CDP-diacylglycerol--glycerol-3-phosphate 3-phosphatidyltransferase